VAAQTTHVLLGAGGAISRTLTEVLLAQGAEVTWVSRRGTAVPRVRAIQADLLDAGAARIAPEATAYLVAGLPYRADVWAEQWPRLIANVLRACEARDARLVVFDNVYLYGRAKGAMTEDTPARPCSRKGEVRARIAEAVLQAATTGRGRALIARSADFYGPYGEASSLPGIFIFGRLAGGARAQWPVNAEVPHSFTYTGDCGRALALLAAAEDAYGQVWHLPTANPPLTAREFAGLAATALGATPGLSVLPRWVAQVGGIFDTTVHESIEMLYQYEADYVFSSAKFERRFGLAPTPYPRGIAETARWLQAGRAANDARA